MPRRKRLIAPNAYYHIIARGNNKQVLFEQPEDFNFFLAKLKKYKEKFDVAILHYCLMNNHIHLLVRNSPERNGISKMMHGLQTAYAIRYGKKTTKTGHVFENRFKHLHITDECYLLECARYIEKNPVRANLVSNPKDYPWSSYLYYAYGRPNSVITRNILYEALAATEAERQILFRRYVKKSRAYEGIIDAYFEERVNF